MIIERISEGQSPQAILQQLDRLTADTIIDASTAEQLRRYVQDTCLIPVDTGVLDMAPHQRTLLAHEMFAPTQAMKEVLQQTLDASKKKLQSVWCSSKQKYVQWESAGLDSAPSQYIAFQQLKFRWENKVPIAVCLVAPAGYGKSELLAAWRAYTTLDGTPWDAVAPTGVAASQIGGGCPSHPSHQHLSPDLFLS